MKKTNVYHPSQLNSLTVFGMFRKRGLGTIELDQSFEHPEREKLQKDINANYYACGCTTGAKGLMVFLVFGLGASGWFYVTDKFSLGEAGLWTAGSAIGGAIVGKILGLVKAERKLKKTVHTIQAYWKVKDEKTGSLILCG